MKSRRGVDRSLVVMVMVVVGAFGCTQPGSITMNSRRSQVVAPPIERLLVLVNLKSRGFSDAMYFGFSTALEDQLRACEIMPKLFHAEPGNETWPTVMDAEARGFGPNAALLIRATGEHVYLKRDVTKFASMVIELRIELPESGAELWRAKLVFQVDTGGPSSQDNENGKRLASFLTDRLRQDGLLDRCPAVAARDAS
jgi:hypothetical protein